MWGFFYDSKKLVDKLIPGKPKNPQLCKLTAYEKWAARAAFFN